MSISNNLIRLREFYQPLAVEYEKNNMRLNILFLCAGNTCRSATAGVIGKYIFDNTANINSAGLRIRGSSGGPMKRKLNDGFVIILIVLLKIQTHHICLINQKN